LFDILYININQFKEFVESHHKIPVVIGTHPISLKYYDAHVKLSFWNSMKMDKTCGHLLAEDKELMALYD